MSFVWVTMYSMVYSTAADEEEGKRIGRSVIAEKLAACVNIFPIKSIYWWKGKIEKADEQAMIFKTKSELVPSVIEKIQEESTYEVPCAVSYEMSGGGKNYLEWIEDSTA
ncbi:MAG: divalent-cation tolerance protein CutA [Thermoplasmata archaeon]